MAWLPLEPSDSPPAAEFSREAILAAGQRLAGRIHRTPVLQSRWLNQELGCEVWFKCEHFQRGGAFKIRGATNALLQLTPAQAGRGVVTHSSGNHAQALALAAQMGGIECTVVMPENSPAVKMQATRDRGARVVLCPPTQADRIATTQAIMQETGATLIHPFDDPRIILGQATAAWELLEEVPDLDAIWAPVGGGGLLAGTCLSAAWFDPARRIPVYGAEPAGADDSYRSLQSGQLVTQQQPQTIADGLLTTLGQWTWPILRQQLQGLVTVSDDEIQAAMQIFWERLKWVVEPSGAVSLAALRQWLADVDPATDPATEPTAGANRPRKIGVIISGGNRDFSPVPVPNPVPGR